MKLFSFAVLIAFFLSACATSPRIVYEQDPNQDFSSYRSFSWISEQPENVQSDYIVSSFAIQSIKDAIQNELENKGYRFVEDRDQADMAIGFTVGARDKIRVTRTIDPFYNVDRWTWGHQLYGVRGTTLTNEVSEYTDGMLAIDVFDVKRKAPVWHGAAKKRLTRSQKEGATGDVPAAVSAILTAFPIKQN